MRAKPEDISWVAISPQQSTAAVAASYRQHLAQRLHDISVRDPVIVDNSIYIMGYAYGEDMLIKIKRKSTDHEWGTCSITYDGDDASVVEQVQRVTRSYFGGQRG